MALSFMEGNEALATTTFNNMLKMLPAKCMVSACREKTKLPRWERQGSDRNSRLSLSFFLRKKGCNETLQEIINDEKN